MAPNCPIYFLNDQKVPDDAFGFDTFQISTWFSPPGHAEFFHQGLKPNFCFNREACSWKPVISSLDQNLVGTNALKSSSSKISTRCLYSTLFLKLVLKCFIKNAVKRFKSWKNEWRKTRFFLFLLQNPVSSTYRDELPTFPFILSLNFISLPNYKLDLIIEIPNGSCTLLEFMTLFQQQCFSPRVRILIERTTKKC